ncbi:MAG: chemotaxis protein MotB [Desulfovibrionales bacterium]|jgi:chemotaxis protein MotB|nr:chemotaxis protein MotB [Desulfovibrionales bacterium]
MSEEGSKKTPPPQDEEGLPAWMATFADMVTLLLCFFVLLLSFAQTNVQKFKEALGSVQDSFGVRFERREADFVALIPSRMKERSDIKMSKDSQILLGLVLRLKDIVEDDKNLEKSTGVRADKNGVLLFTDSAAMFSGGSTKLSPEARTMLDRVAKLLKELNLDVVIRGHTDDSEYRQTNFPSNWELSSARAAAALEYLLSKGIPATRLKAVGFADTRPMFSNDSPANRQRNRRIELYFHRPEDDSW